MPQTAGNDAQQAAGPLPSAFPFDHRTSDVRNLGFDYARSAFASAGLDWSPERLAGLHLHDAEGRATNTALLLSDQCPSAIKCAVFSGDTKADLAERLTISGSVLNQIDAAPLFLNRHNPEDAWPHAALRESLVNAVLHRDYERRGPILISVFDSSVEIVSPGGLVDGFEVNDLLNGVSEARNPWLADVFEALHLCENYGTGVQRILDAYSQSLASPQLRVGPGSVAMILPKPVLGDAWPKAGMDDDGELATGDGTEYDGISHDGHAAPDDDGGKAKRYIFPSGGQHLFTTVPARALAGSRVLSVASLPSLVLSGEKAWRSMGGERSLAHTGPTAAAGNHENAGTARPGDDGQDARYHIDTLAEITMHLFARKGTELSLREIERRLGTDSGRVDDVLAGLAEQGRLRATDDRGTIRYSLP
ncbi:ATP-binding protein [Bifidobacterium sp. ESL0763]|uniref:ATP-binding protein n=1 Tax=Bifidobacterium sp. ESL0763 TaxID=2983227 RepID=UPI0023F937E4|nr:ATP-binding protein [Bifidobacterium sp. ESL0763]MDF7663621.1 ATP-binding protein [Bifidobacterium sp. ESL0763]